MVASAILIRELDKSTSGDECGNSVVAILAPQTPALREQADRARFYARMFEAHMLRGDDAVVKRLLAYVVELEAQAAALERKAA